MFDFAHLLPRVVLEVDARVNAQENSCSREVFLSVCNQSTDVGLLHGTFKAGAELLVTGFRYLCITDTLAPSQSRFQLAVNGLVQGSPFVVPALSREGVVELSVPITVTPADLISLLCIENGSAPASLVVYAVVAVDLYTDTVLQKLLRVMGSEYETNRQLIEQLLALIDCDNCPSYLLSSLSRLSGFSILNNWSPDVFRLFLKGLGDLYHRTGQKLPFSVLLNMLGFADHSVYQLYKKSIYEVADYSTLQEGTHIPVKSYSAVLPGVLQNDKQNVGFLLTAGCSISGIEINLRNRGVDSGAVSVYLTVNGVVDSSRFATLLSNQSHIHMTFSSVTMTVPSLVGFFVHQDSPQSNDDDGWMEIFLDLGYDFHYAYPAARLDVRSKEAQTLLSPSSDLEFNLDSFRPVHVLIRKEALAVVTKPSSLQKTLHESVSVASSQQIVDELLCPSDSPFVVAQPRNPSILTHCTVVCETVSQV